MSRNILSHQQSPYSQPHPEQNYLERVLRIGDFNDKRRCHSSKDKRTRTKRIPNMIRQRIIPYIPRIQMSPYRRLPINPSPLIQGKTYLATRISIEKHPQPIPLIHTPKHISSQPAFRSIPKRQSRPTTFRPSHTEREFCFPVNMWIGFLGPDCADDVGGRVGC